MEQGDTEPKRGTTTSLVAHYVIKKGNSYGNWLFFTTYIGTCSHCRDLGRESHIAQGDLFWTKGKGTYARKYHFDCYRPSLGRWKEEEVSDALKESMLELKEADRKKVKMLIGEPMIEKKKKKRAPAKKKKKEQEEEEEEEEEYSVSPKKKSF